MWTIRKIGTPLLMDPFAVHPNLSWLILFRVFIEKLKNECDFDVTWDKKELCEFQEFM